MRFAPTLALPLLVLGCSGGSKTGEAVAYAAMAGAVTAAQLAAAERAAHNSPSRHEYYVGCAASDCYSDPEVDLDGARAYALLYLNRVRAEQGVGPLALDYPMNAFAQAGSKELAFDHRPHQHIADYSRSCFQCTEEQSDPNGVGQAPVRDQLLGLLDGMMSQGPGGASHDNLLGPAWHRLGVGIANPDGKTYVTIDLSP